MHHGRLLREQLDLRHGDGIGRIDSKLPYNTDEPFQPVIVRPDVPADVEKLLREVQDAALDPRDVTAPTIGLRIQYQAGLVEKDELMKILEQKRALRKLIDEGKFVP